MLWAVYDYRKKENKVKTWKRIVVGVLVLLLIVTAIPENCFSSLAITGEKTNNEEESIQNEENIEVEETVTESEVVTYAMATNTAIITESGNSISRAEWLHNLVVVFDMMVETSALPDNYFTDLQTSHKYYEDILLAVTFGVVNEEEGTELRPNGALTRDFAVSTLNYCLGFQLSEDVQYTFLDVESCSDPMSAQIAIDRGWLEMIDGYFSPETYLTTEEAEIMIADAQEVLEGQIVDKNHENVYEFAEDVVVITDGTIVDEDENGVITITNTPEEISVGDKFAVYFNGIPCVYTAQTVTINDAVTVIETESVDSDVAFETVDAEGIIGTDDMEIIPAEGVEVKFEEDNSGASTYAIKKTKNLTTEIPLSFGGVTAKVSVKIKNPYVEYNVEGDKAYATFHATTETTYSISGNVMEMGGLKRGLTLFTVNVLGVGSFDIVINVDFSGSASGTVKGDLVAGVECSKSGGIRAIKNFVQKESYTNAEASFAVSLRAVFGVTKMPVLSASVYAEVGIRASFSKKTYADDKSPKQCVHHAAYLYANYGAMASAKLGVWKTSESVTYTIFDENNSPVRIVNHYEDGNLVAKCTRGNVYKSYYTTASSRWSGCGWTGANGTYALNSDGTPFVLYNYTLNDNNEATITQYNGNAWSVYIPKEIDGYMVVAIGTEAFQYKDVGYVVIPDTVIEIGAGAFQRCTNLQTVKMSNSLTTIGTQAFYECTSLANVELPKTLTTMGYNVFYNCDALTEIFIPKALENVSTVYQYIGPFSECSNLRKVIFEEGITFIEHNLFAGCDGLESIEIPSTVTIIHTNAFYDCENLETVKMSNSLTTIDTQAFHNCTSLTDVELPKSLTTMGYNVFYNCDALTEIFIPKALKNVSTVYAYTGPFSECSNLRKVIFEEGITFVENNLFAGCDGLESIEIPSTVTIIHTNAFYDCENLETVKMSNSLTTIDTQAFYECSSLRNVEFPNTLITIETEAFGACSSIENIEIPDSVTSMGDGVFYGCASLESVILPSRCVNITSSLFSGCTSLTLIEFPETIEVIRPYAFYGCAALERFTFAGESSLKEIQSDAFSNCSSLKEAILPETTTTIGWSAFQDCIVLGKVYIPQSTKTLGAYAFKGCEMLSEVTIADYSITTIEAQTFKDCPALRKIVLPKGLATICSQAFMNCTSLTEVVIPESVTSIESTAFSYPDKTTIYGKSGSYAETFAIENGFKFVDNAVPSEGIALLDGVDYIVMDRGETYRAIFEFYPENSTDVITLTANNTRVSINGHDITANSTGDTVITATASSGVTYEFTIHIRNANKIAITTQPSKVSYIMGEELDLTGMVVQVTYNDGTTREVTDYTVSGFDSSVEGKNTVTVKWVSPYGTSYTTTFDVEIIDPRPKLTGIVVDTMPIKREYERKESLDLTGLVIKATYTDGSSVAVTDYTVSGYNALKNGIQTITVTYNDFTTTFTVAVGQKLIVVGDVNGDAVIDVGDAIVISMYDAGLIELTVDQLSAADVNGDGVVDAGDAIVISMYDAGLITEI